jgi:hypothetical protein
MAGINAHQKALGKNARFEKSEAYIEYLLMISLTRAQMNPIECLLAGPNFVLFCGRIMLISL